MAATKNKEIFLIWIVHGFNNGPNQQPDNWSENLSQSYIKRYQTETREVLIGIVDWTVGARNFFTNYGESAINTIVIGRYMALLSHQIRLNQLSISSSRTICVGHSLGAHVCGFFGKTLKEKEFFQDSRLDKIIGKYSRDLNIS